MTEDRIIDLEVKYAHQMLTLEELQQAVFTQARTIETLKKTVKILTEQLGLGNGAPTIGPGNEKPPHY